MCQVVAPRQRQRGIPVRLLRLNLARDGAVEEHDTLPNFGRVPQIQDMPRRQPTLRPLPFRLPESQMPAIPPMRHVLRAFDPDTVARRMKQDVLAILDQDAHILAAIDAPSIRPRFEIVSVRHTRAVLFVETPPSPRYVLVFQQIRVDHAPHLRFGDIRSLDGY